MSEFEPAGPAVIEPGAHPHPPASERGFWFFMGLQFQNAFSDNVFKQFMILGLVPLIWHDSASQQSSMNGVIAAVFILPYLLFSTWSGFLADKFSKRKIILATKLIEVFIMVGSFVALLAGHPITAFYGSLAMLFMLGTQATLFSPSKYGIIPELVLPRRLAWANGVIELTTFLAIIWGTASATLLLKWFNYTQYHYVALLLIVLSAVGFVAGYGVDRTPAANPRRPFEWNFFPELLRYCRVLRRNRRLGLTVLGISYFWGLGSILLTHLNVWGEHSLGLSTTNAGWLAIILSMGIGLGALAAGYLSHGTIELGLVPLGGIGLTVSLTGMAFAQPSLLIPMFVLVFFVGVSAGFFSLPLNAVLQHDSDLADRGGVLGANNFFNSAAMVGSSIFLILFNSVFKTDPGAGSAAAKAGAAAHHSFFHGDSNTIFFVLAAASLVATIYLMQLIPEALIRFVAFIVTRILYRVRRDGIENIPEHGPVLLVANHTALVDALLIMAASPRPVRFLVWQGLYDSRVLRWFLTQMRCIPVGSLQRPRELLKSLRGASEALANGEVLCIFAEGEITRTGRMLPFRRGYEYILKNAPAPVVPVFLEGVWGSIFSFEGGKFIWKRPRQLPYPVNIHVGKALPHDTPPWRLRQEVAKLGAEAAIAARPTAQPLHRRYIKTARQHWGSFFALDPMTPAVTHGGALIRSIILARWLRKEWAGQERVGLLLPPSVGGALANIAAVLGGRTAVNLNYTVGAKVMEHCVRAAELKSVVTVRVFMQTLKEKLKLELPADLKLIYLDDMPKKPGVLEIACAVLLAKFGTVRAIERTCGARGKVGPDTLATIIFSSGSTGTPKGVMLSHFNIASDIESFKRGVRILPHDKLLGTLPFFHSFGYTVSLWGALLFPFGMVYHHNPLDLKTVGELTEKNGVTVLITTPTFLGHYMKRIPPQQFGGVNLIITGAEKLSDALRLEFKEKFGIEPLQGFGTTELSPVVSTNLDDFRAPGFRQQGNKAGSVGQALPMQAVEIRHAETGAMLPPGESGLLWVRGPNVMEGYLGMPEKTAEVIKAGWYNTGDMAQMDEDGFIFITGRQSRFSKIGGEMVPHGAVEDKLTEVLGLKDQALVVTGVPDESKGEKLVVLHTLSDEQLAGYNEKLAAAGVPNLWIPRKENFKKVEAIPMLGTGKLDLQKVNELAKGEFSKIPPN